MYYQRGLLNRVNYRQPLNRTISRPISNVSSLRVLGLESSCDETGIAVVSLDKKVLSSQLHSQWMIHHAHGGVVPTIARRKHAEHINALISAALLEARTVTVTDQDAVGKYGLEVDEENHLKNTKANVAWLEEVMNNFNALNAHEAAMGHCGSSSTDVSKLPITLNIDAIAVTQGPGLSGCLGVGVDTARALSRHFSKPMVAVNHVLAHGHVSQLNTPVKYPYLALIVSGGHSQVQWVEGPDDATILASTVDDAVGEAFDKAHRLLALEDVSWDEVEQVVEQTEDAVYHQVVATMQLPHVAGALLCDPATAQFLYSHVPATTPTYTTTTINAGSHNNILNDTKDSMLNENEAAASSAASFHGSASLVEINAALTAERAREFHRAVDRRLRKSNQGLTDADNGSGDVRKSDVQEDIRNSETGADSEKPVTPAPFKLKTTSVKTGSDAKTGSNDKTGSDAKTGPNATASNTATATATANTLTSTSTSAWDQKVTLATQMNAEKDNEEKTRINMSQSQASNALASISFSAPNSIKTFQNAFLSRIQSISQTPFVPLPHVPCVKGLLSQELPPELSHISELDDPSRKAPPPPGAVVERCASLFERIVRILTISDTIGVAYGHHQPMEQPKQDINSLKSIGITSKLSNLIPSHPLLPAVLLPLPLHNTTNHSHTALSFSGLKTKIRALTRKEEERAESFAQGGLNIEDLPYYLRLCVDKTDSSSSASSNVLPSISILFKLAVAAQFQSTTVEHIAAKLTRVVEYMEYGKYDGTVTDQATEMQPSERKCVENQSAPENGYVWEKSQRSGARWLGDGNIGIYNEQYQYEFTPVVNGDGVRSALTSLYHRESDIVDALNKSSTASESLIAEKKTDNEKSYSSPANPLHLKSEETCVSVDLEYTLQKCGPLLTPDTPRQFVIAGGVACNKFLREGVSAVMAKLGFTTYYTPPSLCTDNGVMIAWAGVQKLAMGHLARPNIKQKPRWPVGAEVFVNKPPKTKRV